ncbi:hypothetical protein L3V82_01640 [Thiotrichales bacterium 19S3-7]|nr:hypothetical protein [Thiotrichales bacterium 19S3-7]MCF6800866.1 hypothetical protein [Thiotrichales bacterium 19S3-11]
MFQSIRKWVINRQCQRDPYYEVLYVSAVAILAVLVNGVVFFAFQLDNYLMAFILGVLAVVLCNLPFYMNDKIAKVKAIFYMYILSLIAYAGIIAVSVNMTLIISYFLFLSFIFYLTTLKNSLYRFHVSAILSLSAVLVHLSDGSYQQLWSMILNLTITFTIALCLTIVYPERKADRIQLGIDYILLGISDLSKDNDIDTCKDKFYALAKHTIELGRLFKTNDNLQLQKAINSLRYTLLAMNFVYIKAERNVDILHLNQKISDVLTYRAIPQKVKSNASMVEEAISMAENSLYEYFLLKAQIQSKRQVNV